MADKKEKKEKAPKAEKVKSGKKGLPLPLMIVLVIIGLIFLSITLVLVVGMLPAIVLSATDRSPKRNLTVGVGALNLSSTLYVIFALIKRGPTVEYAIQLLMDPANYLIMWAGAALALVLHKVIPAVVAQALAGMAEIKIQRLRENQKELKKTWGDGVG